MRCAGPLTVQELNFAAGAGEASEALVERLTAKLQATDSSVVRLVAFTPRDQADRFHALLADAFGAVDFPVTILCGRGRRAEHEVLGLQAFIVAGAPTEPIWLDDRVVGTLYRDNEATYLSLGNVLPDQPWQSELEQCLSVFEVLERVLAPYGADIHHVVRTWLFADRILDWYDELNAARHRVFRERGVFGRRVPASTGVGIGNAPGAALVADALAIVPHQPGVAECYPVPSPLQCPALDYGSAFSRAMELDLPGGRRLMISGTASIEPCGATVHDTVDEQIDWTMQVVSAILASRGMSHEDVYRALVYYADEIHFGGLEAWQRAQGLPTYPALSVQADICRGDLLFEVELDAFTTRPA